MLNRIKNNTAGYVTIDYPWVDLATPTLAESLLRRSHLKCELTPNFTARVGLKAVHRLLIDEGDAGSAIAILTNNGLLPE